MFCKFIFEIQKKKKYFTSKWKLILCGKNEFYTKKITNREKNWTPLRRAIHRINGHINWNNHTYETLKNWMKIHLLYRCLSKNSCKWQFFSVVSECCLLTISNRQKKNQCLHQKPFLSSCIFSNLTEEICEYSAIHIRCASHLLIVLSSFDLDKCSFLSYESRIICL